MEDNRKEALNKATKAKQKMAVEAEMMKQLQPTVPEVTAANIDMQPAINPNPKPDGPVINQTYLTQVIYTQVFQVTLSLLQHGIL